MELLSLPRVERHLNLTDSVYATLKTAIIENTLAAGSRLTEAALAEQIGVSNTPVREAISRLEREGLVQYLPRRGAVVVSITAEDIREVLEVREVLEAHAIVRALQRRTPGLDRRLAELVAEAEPLVAARDQRGFSRLDMELHRLLVQASGNRRLLRVFENMHDQFLMIRWRAFDVPGRPLAGHLEHKEILAAFLAGDAAEAERRLRWHHQHTRQDLEAALASAGGTFGD
ncbi:MAG: GntR family transcriptional regulator [Chloroflexi bacterium]|nr:GntR family transcriptional regulator [Chloroflexota bacterium]MCL5110879.1 GntR family transcriptional regulator [Chloroflexota bacterium]